MEDSFKVRVDKIFGSLNTSSSSPAPSSSLSSLWSLTDEEIERKEWNRDRKSPEPELHPSFFTTNREMADENRKLGLRSQLEEDLEDLDEEEDVDDDDQLGGGSSSRSAKPDDYNDEEWEVKSAIGRDCTLDFEEEEDEYDKVAVGEEKIGDEDRVYMREVADYGIDVDSSIELPSSIKEVVKDPRANHLAAKRRIKEDEEAAKLRLKEDVETAEKIDSLRVCEEEEAPQPSMDTGTNISEDGAINPKSILKRKDNHLDSKSQKRVRFDPECKDNGDTELNSKEAGDVSNGSYASGVPDYLRNPSRYTHYTFDSSGDLNEESNKQAYMDFMKLLNKSNNGTESPAEDQDGFVGSVKFIPRKKAADTSAMVENCTELVQQVGIGKNSTAQKGRLIGIAAGEVEESDVCAMEEDEPEGVGEGRSSLQKPGRRYRVKQRSEIDE
ncbi:hypothetical protein UlMin_013911 [Ulmus minor]